MTAAELRRAEARYQRSRARSEEDRRHRNSLVHQALAEGWKKVRVAEALGVSESRVGQIAKSR